METEEAVEAEEAGGAQDNVCTSAAGHTGACEGGLTLTLTLTLTHTLACAPKPNDTGRSSASANFQCILLQQP